MAAMDWRVALSYRAAIGSEHGPGPVIALFILQGALWTKQTLSLHFKVYEGNYANNFPREITWALTRYIYLRKEFLVR